MTVAENLLRLCRWQLEERRRYLQELESLGERLRADAHRLADEIASAPARRGFAGLAGPGNHRLAKRLLERKQTLEDSLAEIQNRIVEARAALLAAESEFERQKLGLTQSSEGGDAARRRRRFASTLGTAFSPARNRR
jgi:phage shock protein A